MITPIRPRFEGANIGTWVGFKHLMYLVEEAVLQWFRNCSIGPQSLYSKYGLGLAVIDSSVLLLALVEIDDELIADVVETKLGHYSVTLRVRRDGVEVVAVKGRVRVALVPVIRDSSVKAVPDEIAGLVIPNVSASSKESDHQDLRIANPDDLRTGLISEDPKAFIWSWQTRYFHCHYSERVQHSAYVRALEEVVDRFLCARGISIPHFLADRGWIPVVSRVRLAILADVQMDETMHTTFAVEDVLKSTLYDGVMNCYVQRGDIYAHTAHGRILHGYANTRGEGRGKLVELDAQTISALTAEC